MQRIETCAYVGKKEPSKEGFEAPYTSIRGASWVKPEGGLWTSPYEAYFGSPWCQWCLTEEFRVKRDHPYFHLWLLEPDPNSHIYVIDSEQDLIDLVAAYPAKPISPGYPFEYPDWLKVAEDFDGVHLTDEGQWQTRMSQPANLYGWDCECTLWLRWKFTDVKELGLMRVGRRSYEYAE